MKLWKKVLIASAVAPVVLHISAVVYDYIDIAIDRKRNKHRGIQNFHGGHHPPPAYFEHHGIFAESALMPSRDIISDLRKKDEDKEILQMSDVMKSLKGIEEKVDTMIDEHKKIMNDRKKNSTPSPKMTLKRTHNRKKGINSDKT